jgi:hypothetical protein
VVEALIAARCDDVELELLDEERVRDQLCAAEELHHIGHAEPAVIAAGATLAGVLRLRAGLGMGRSASCGALLEALLATGTLSPSDHEILYRLLHAHDQLTRGYAPHPDAALGRRERDAALAILVHMVERLPPGTGDVPGARSPT